MIERGLRNSGPLLIACALCVAAAAAAPVAQPGRQPATRPTTTPSEIAPSRAAVPSPAPASQPTTRSAAGQVPLRRDAAQTQPVRATSRTTVPQPEAPGLDFGRVLGALAIVLGIIFALRWVLRRTLQPGMVAGATGAVQVLSRSPLSPRQHLLLLRVGRRLIVAADCNGQLSSLSEITDPDEVAALVGQVRDEKLTSASKCFGNMLGRWKQATEEQGGDAEEEFPRVPPDVYDGPRGGEAPEGRGEDAAVAGARGEIHSLTERVRLISHQFKQS